MNYFCINRKYTIPIEFENARWLKIEIEIVVTLLEDERIRSKISIETTVQDCDEKSIYSQEEDGSNGFYITLIDNVLPYTERFTDLPERISRTKLSILPRTYNKIVSRILLYTIESTRQYVETNIRTLSIAANRHNNNQCSRIAEYQEVS